MLPRAVKCAGRGALDCYRSRRQTAACSLSGMHMVRLQVSIDGASATGKTTLGLRLARRYRAIFLGTGFTYRTAEMLLAKSLETVQRVASGEWLTSFTHQVARFPAAEAERVYVHGQDVTDIIWSADIDTALTDISESASARAAILRYHSALISDASELSLLAGKLPSLSSRMPTSTCSWPLPLRSGRIGVGGNTGSIQITQPRPRNDPPSTRG